LSPDRGATRHLSAAFAVSAEDADFAKVERRSSRDATDTGADSRFAKTGFARCATFVFARRLTGMLMLTR
jgi:hypothetical protein